MGVPMKTTLATTILLAFSLSLPACDGCNGTLTGIDASRVDVTDATSYDAAVDATDATPVAVVDAGMDH